MILKVPRWNGILILCAVSLIGWSLAGCGGTARQDIMKAPLAPAPSAEQLLGERPYYSARNAPPPVGVVSAPDQALDLDACLKLAEERSLTLDSADQSELGALWNRWRAVTNFLPTGNTAYSLRRADHAPTTSVLGLSVPTGKRNTYQWKVEFSQPLFAGFRNLATYRLAELGIDSARFERLQARNDLYLAVKQAYYGILNREKSLNVARQTVKSLQSHLEVANNFYAVGMVPKSDVLEAEVELARAIQNQTVYEHELVIYKARLNNLLRQPVTTEVRVTDSLKHHTFPLTQRQCLDISIAERPEIKLLRAAAESRRQDITVARSQLYPTISVSTTHTRMGDRPEVAGGPGLDRSEWGLAAVASFNFWEWGRSMADIQRGKVALNRALNDYDEMEEAVQLEVSQAYQQLLSAEKNIGVSSKAIDAAAEDLRMIVERYQDQVSTSTDVLDAQTRYSQAQYDYYQALYNFNLAWATLEQAIGREVRAAR